MNRTTFLKVAICFLSVLTVYSCKKNNNSPSVVYDQTKLSDLFSDLKSTPQSFTVTAGAAQTILGAGAPKSHFMPTHLKDASGNVITSGTINIS